MNKTFINALVPHQKVNTYFALQKKTLRKTRNGDPFLSCTLSDKTGTLSATMWWSEHAPALWDACTEGMLVAVEGVTETYRNQLQLKIENITPFLGKADPADFIAARSDIPELYHELTTILDTITTPHLRSLLDHYFSDETFVQEFKAAPAAKSWHDSVIGGLLHHTLNIIRLCDSICTQYRSVAVIDRELLLVAALFHDAGKINEYDYGGVTIDKTNEGRLIGHTNHIIIELGGVIASIPDFPKEQRDHLLHLIISHHGHLEFGASVLPSTLEAVILHGCDLIESMVTGISDLPATHADTDWLFVGTLSRWIKLPTAVGQVGTTSLQSLSQEQVSSSAGGDFSSFPSSSYPSPSPSSSPSDAAGSQHALF